MDPPAAVAAYDAAQHALAPERRTQSVGEARTSRPWPALRRGAPGPARARSTPPTPTAWRRSPASIPEISTRPTLYAESLMDLRPWNYWDRTGSRTPGPTRSCASCESVLSGDPEHPAPATTTSTPSRRWMPPSAPSLRRAAGAPDAGAGHLVHMPAHIYIRVGRYDDAAESNVHAIHDDETFIEGQHPTSVYLARLLPSQHPLSRLRLDHGGAEQAGARRRPRAQVQGEPGRGPPGADAAGNDSLLRASRSSPSAGGTR